MTLHNRYSEEELRIPVDRADFKSVERRDTTLVGSTPTLFRHLFGAKRSIDRSNSETFNA